jgi:hypothetical protein
MTKLYQVLKDVVRPEVLSKKNKDKSWEYGWDPKHDFVVISKDGTIGPVYEVNGLRIALPMPKDIQNRDAKWQPQEYPKDLAKIKTIFDWNKYDNEFKTKWIDYIETEFDRSATTVSGS